MSGNSERSLIPVDENTPLGEPVQLEGGAFSDSFAVVVPDSVYGSTAIPNVTGKFVVAFSRVCTHMGCHLFRSESDHNIKYPKSESESLFLTCGPCPCHGTTFDLLKGGLVVLGPATQNLAQLKIEASTDNKLYATSWLGHPEPSSRLSPWELTNSDDQTA